MTGRDEDPGGIWQPGASLSNALPVMLLRAREAVMQLYRPLFRAAGLTGEQRIVRLGDAARLGRLAGPLTALECHEDPVRHPCRLERRCHSRRSRLPLRARISGSSTLAIALTAHRPRRNRSRRLLPTITA